MISKEKLESIEIFDWKQFGKNFDEADLLLGNGFSLSLSGKFTYSSLFEEFLKNCSKETASIFGKFETTNFELIQEKLLNAQTVNSILGKPNPEIDKLIGKLQSGLITTIEQNHPRAQEMDWDQLKRIAQQFDSFNDIFTLNYDLYLYHLIMLCKDRHTTDPQIRPYQDYFWSHFDDSFLTFMDYQNYKHYKHVYYLHGALFLFKHAHNNLKLKRGGEELIELVSRTIRNGDMPLFVSEGTPNDKVDAISRSDYLRFAMTNLKRAKDRLVIYGASLADPDQHIVSALNRTRRNIAVSIHIAGKTSAKLKSEMHDIQSRLSMHDLIFFDAGTLFQF